MATPVADRLSRMGYDKARYLLLGTGLTVLVLVALVMYARRVDTVEVVAALLFIPVFLGLLFKGFPGGLVAGVLAAVVYVVLRYPAIEAVGAGEFAGLIASRSLSYVLFGVVGGWSSRVLESSLDKLELYDQVDDETGLSNARFFLQQTDLELARAKRYQTMFSVVVLDIPAQPLAALGRRRRAAMLRNLGRKLGDGLRNVDHIAHAHDGDHHRLAAILPETGSEGAEVFRSRFADEVAQQLASSGAPVDPAALRSQAVTLPGDEEALASLRGDFTRIDQLEHPVSAAGDAAR